MLSERALSRIVHNRAARTLELSPSTRTHVPGPKPGMHYMLYLHVPFCARLCPYCSFNRYPYHEEIARPYFEHMRKEMHMLADLGYDFESIYIGGGTPTIMMDELVRTIDDARDTFHIREVSCETNPNHLAPEYIEQLEGRVQRLSVGVQSFDDTLLKQMDRYWKYGSGDEILELIDAAAPHFDSLNVDMIFNFPSQTEEILKTDLAKIEQCHCQQVTFSPLYVSHATTRKMEETLGKMDYDREYRYYQMVDETLTGGSDPAFERCTLWTFNRLDPTSGQAQDKNLMVDEYAVAYEEYPAIGSGSIAHLDGTLFVNTFSISAYNEAIDEGCMPLMGEAHLSAHDLECYDFLIQLYHLRFDKRAFEQRFGKSVERALPTELAFLRLNHAFATDDDAELTLTPMGRYLTLVMYRQFLSGMNELRDQARAALTGPEHELLFGDGSPA